MLMSFRLLPFSGNSLTVFPDSELSNDAGHFSSITKEMRYFESTFLSAIGPRDYAARVFAAQPDWRRTDDEPDDKPARRNLPDRGSRRGRLDSVFGNRRP